MNKKIQEQSILKSGFYTMSMGVLGKAFGFISTLLTAYYFGANTKTDIIFFACLIIFTLSTLFSAYNSNILLPQLLKSTPSEKTILINYSFTRLTGYLLISFGLIYSFHLDFFSIFSKFKIDQLQEAHLSIVLLLPILILQPLNDLMINIAQSFKNYSLSNLSSLLVGICNVSCLLFLSSILQENSLALGFLCASISQFFLFYLYLYKKQLHPKLSLKQPHNNRAISSLLFPTVLLQLVSSILLILPDFFASSLNEGTLSLMSYGKRVFDLIPTLFIYPIVLVFYPRICEWINQKNLSLLKAKLLLLIQLLFLFISPCAFFLMAYSSDIISLLFFKAKLNQSQLSIASNCLCLMALSTPAFIVSSISGRLIAASQTKNTFYLQLLIQGMGSLLLAILITMLIDIHHYLAILYALLIYHLIYSQLSNLVLINSQIVKFSILKFFSLEAAFCLVPVFVAYISYTIKSNPSLPYPLAMSLGFYIVCNGLLIGFFYKRNQKSIKELLNS
ncbi:MAG: hypothetical protein KC646_07610 [Candidatus Cloacimonetes bacterium]|nr:hypothetical protein [Candidatus Cloacimonadota bacterium]